MVPAAIADPPSIDAALANIGVAAALTPPRQAVEAWGANGGGVGAEDDAPLPPAMPLRSPMNAGLNPRGVGRELNQAGTPDGCENPADPASRFAEESEKSDAEHRTTCWKKTYHMTMQQAYARSIIPQEEPAFRLHSLHLQRCRHRPRRGKRPQLPFARRSPGSSPASEAARGSLLPTLPPRPTPLLLHPWSRRPLPAP